MSSCGYSIHSNNSTNLTLPAHGYYQLNNNSGSITIGKDSQVVALNNLSSISIADKCFLVEASGNSGVILVGQGSTIDKAKNNVGKLSFGSYSTIKNIDGNGGVIQVGSYSKIPASINGNGGKIEIEAHCNIPRSALYGVGNECGEIWINGVLQNKPNVNVNCPSPSSVQIIQPAVQHQFVQTNSSNVVGVPGMAVVTDPVSESEESFDSNNLCIICIERTRNIAFLCGHTACETCAGELKSCHMCRLPIEKKIKLYD